MPLSRERRTRYSLYFDLRAARRLQPVEEKIEELLAAKQQLARDLLEGGGELPLTEMSDDELLRLVALDIRQVAGDD